MSPAPITYHFISGLPRAGSTLLAAILRQNPHFHAEMTSPIGALFNNMLHQFAAGSEFGPTVTHEQRRRLARALFDAYYAGHTDKKVIFDTNRLWCSKMPVLADQFPESKVIACVRNVAWVMDSIERKYRANPYELTRMFNDDIERNTVYSRVDTLAQRNRLVGFAWSALKEAFYGEHAQSLLLIEYDLLASSPQQVMPLIYKFINMPYFDHDFEHVYYDAPAFDNALGMSGLHKVRPQVRLDKRNTVLPPDLFDTYNQMSFWKNQAGSAANVITVTNKSS